MPYLQIENQDNIYYHLIEGDSNKPYLIFLHEGLGCCELWKDYPEKLCAITGCPGLVYDRIGYGKSTALREKRTIHYMHDYALDELPKVLEGIIPDCSYIFVGHSDGGSIALIAAAQRSPLLLGTITEAAHIFVERQTIAGIEQADLAWQKGKLNGLIKYHGIKTETIFKAWSNTWLTPWFAHWNIEYLLPSIIVPLLVIQGRDDQYGSVSQVNNIAEKSMGLAITALVNSCGHNPHTEQPEIVLQLMSNFINKTIEKN